MQGPTEPENDNDAEPAGAVGDSDGAPPGPDTASAPDAAAPARRSVLRGAAWAGAGVVVGGAAGAAAGYAVGNRSEQVAGQLSEPLEESAFVRSHTFTGVAAGTPAMTERALLESSDATWKGDGVRGAHRVVWDVQTTEPVVAVTFDDGPDPRFTPTVLGHLADAGVTATFFMMGVMLERHQDLGRQVVAAGHEVGNHTWSHMDMAFLVPAAIEEEIVRCKRALKDVLGSGTTFFRPPRGELSGVALRVLAQQNYDTFIWSASRELAAVGTPETIAAAVLKQVRPGAIIDLHDSVGRGNFLPPSSATRKSLLARREVEMAALPLILKGVQDAGLRFVGLSGLLEAGSNPGGLSPAIPGRLPPGPTTVPPGPVA
ncbi:MAG: polysaccharide deacetylase family protein [Microthrixaceae bacterium]